MQIVTGVNAQILWEISGNGIERPSYIFGTHHFAPAEMIDTLSGFEDALASVEKVYGEISVEEMSSLAAIQKMSKAMIAPADSTLSKVLSEGEMGLLESYMKHIVGSDNINMQQYEQFTPAAISVLVAQLTTMKAFPNYNARQQLDMYLQQKALAAGKVIGGLESVDDQIEVLFGVSIAEQAKALMRGIDVGIDPITQAQALSRSYLNGDLAELERISSESGMTEEEKSRLIYGRNSAWVNFLIGMIPTASIMIVVGAGHLPGDKGLINMFRQSGFMVNPVTSKIK